MKYFQTTLEWFEHIFKRRQSHFKNRINLKCDVGDRLFQKSTTKMRTSNVSSTFIGNKIVGQSAVIGASPIGAAPTTSFFST